jgi:3-oxoacyl-[acyl-carrier protein] reductase
MRLKDRTAIITGSSSGIGRGVALAFAREGATVVINHPGGSEAALAAEVVREIGDGGGQAIGLAADVSVESEVDRLVTDVLAQLGRVDILVNNAGIVNTAPIHEMPVADWDRLIAVHLRGTFLLTRRVLPGMLARGSGRIINTGSQLAYKGGTGLAHYTAAKGAILGFTRSVALELGASGITINCVAPGATHTPMLANLATERLEQIRQSIPLGRLAEVDDVVPSYVFLASDEGRYYQGQCVSPNGGDVFF